MAYSLMKHNDQYELFRSRIRSFITTEIADNAAEWETQETLPRELFKKMATHNLIGLTVSPQYGGGGHSFLHNVILLEELMLLQAASVAVSIMIEANTVCPLIERFGSHIAREKFLKPVLSGDAIACLAVTEPGGGSDLMNNIKTRAIDNGDHWVITGEKIYITNAPIADTAVVMARTGEAVSGFDMTLIAVPADTSGFKCVSQHAKLGLRSSPTGQIIFDNCVVPKEYTIGPVNQGYVCFSQVISEERLLIANGAAGIARGCFARVMKERHQLSLANRNALDTASEDIIMHIEAAEAFLQEQATLIDGGQPVDKIAACLAKFAICDKMYEIIRTCLAYYGPLQFIEGNWVSQTLRDVRVIPIFAGTSETMQEMYSQAIIRESKLNEYRK